MLQYTYVRKYIVQSYFDFQECQNVKYISGNKNRYQKNVGISYTHLYVQWNFIAQQNNIFVGDKINRNMCDLLQQLSSFLFPYFNPTCLQLSGKHLTVIPNTMFADAVLCYRD